MEGLEPPATCSQSMPSTIDLHLVMKANLLRLAYWNYCQPCVRESYSHDYQFAHTLLTITFAGEAQTRCFSHRLFPIWQGWVDSNHRMSESKSDAFIAWLHPYIIFQQPPLISSDTILSFWRSRTNTLLFCINR